MPLRRAETARNSSDHSATEVCHEQKSRRRAQFDKGIAAKFVLDPHGLLQKAA
jgi:hypothetical protein